MDTYCSSVALCEGAKSASCIVGAAQLGVAADVACRRFSNTGNQAARGGFAAPRAASATIDRQLDARPRS